jgi:hypothetical protein
MCNQGVQASERLQSAAWSILLMLAAPRIVVQDPEFMLSGSGAQQCGPGYPQSGDGTCGHARPRDPLRLPLAAIAGFSRWTVPALRPTSLVVFSARQLRYAAATRPVLLLMKLHHGVPKDYPSTLCQTRRPISSHASSHQPSKGPVRLTNGAHHFC